MIHARSPWYYSLSSPTADEVEFEFYIYTGTVTTDRPATATATIKSTFIDYGDGGSPRVDVDLSPYVRDVIQHECPIALNSITAGEEGSVWVDYRYRTITSGSPTAWTSFFQDAGVRGYAEPSDGKNYRSDTVDKTMFERNERIVLQVPQNSTIYLPFSDFDAGVTPESYALYDGSTYTAINTNLDNALNTSTLITYWPVDFTNGYVSVVEDLGASSYDTLMKFEELYFPDRFWYEIRYVNKYGAIFPMFLWGKPTETIETQQEKYEIGHALETDGTYSEFKRRSIVENKKARRRYTISSEYQPEANNELWRQLFLSDRLWLRYQVPAGVSAVTPFPVNIVDTQMEVKKTKYDRLIQYRITVEEAFDYIVM